MIVTEGASAMTEASGLPGDRDVSIVLPMPFGA
jgi:hypothetical protein